MYRIDNVTLKAIYLNLFVVEICFYQPFTNSDPKNVGSENVASSIWPIE